MKAGYGIFPVRKSGSENRRVGIDFLSSALRD